MVLVAEPMFRPLHAPHCMRAVHLGTQYINGVPVNSHRGSLTAKPHLHLLTVPLEGG